jgi:hypothetical protein
LIQYHIDQKQSREKFERVLKRSEKRDIDEEFTRLCIDRLKKAHNFETLLAAKEQHKNVFKTIQENRLMVPKPVIKKLKPVPNDFSFMLKKTPKSKGALPPKPPSAFHSKRLASKIQ